MTKQIINVGTTANDRNGDSLRAAFQKVNANFTELYNHTSAGVTAGSTAPTDPGEGDLWWDSTSGRLYVYYGTAWVDASPVDGAGISSTDRLVNGAKELVLGNDGVITLPNGETIVSQLSQVYIHKDDGDSSGEVVVQAEGVALQTVSIADGDNRSGRMEAGLGTVQIATAGIQGNSVAWDFNNTGTLNTPLLLPITFTATVDAAHYVGEGSLTLSGASWYFGVSFVVSQNGTVETQIDNPVRANNPGYANNMSFDFTEADHGIPGYTFTVTLVDIQTPSEFVVTTNLTASIPPEYPSTINTSGAIKLTSNGNDLIFGTNGTLTLPVGGDIVDSNGASVLGGGSGNSLTNNGHTISLNSAGNFVLENSGSVFGAPAQGGAKDKITFYDLSDQDNMNYAVGVDSQVLWHSVDTGSSFKWYTDTTVVAELNALHLQLAGQLLVKATDSFNAIQFSDNGTNDSANIKVDGGFNMAIRAASNIYLARAGQNRIAITDHNSDFMASDAVTIQSNKAELGGAGAYTWTFGADGILTVPIVNTAAIQGLSGYDVRIRAVADGNDGKASLENYDGSTTTTQISANSATATIGVGTHTWTFGADSSLTMPGGVSFSGGQAIQLSGGDSITLASATGGTVSVISNSNVWTFGGTGNLTIPGAISTRNTSQVGSKLDIATNIDNGTVGWSSYSMSVAYNADILSTYTTGSTITFQDNTVATITAIEDYTSYIDISWDTPKSGTLFPITLKTSDYAAASSANATIVVGSNGTPGVNTWTFGTDGTLTVPSTIYGNGSSLTLSTGNLAPGSRIDLEGGVVTVNAYGREFAFSTDGTLSLPVNGSITGTTVPQVGVFIRIPYPASLLPATNGDGTFEILDEPEYADIAIGQTVTFYDGSSHLITDITAGTSLYFNLPTLVVTFEDEGNTQTSGTTSFPAVITTVDYAPASSTVRLGQAGKQLEFDNLGTLTLPGNIAITQRQDSVVDDAYNGYIAAQSNWETAVQDSQYGVDNYNQQNPEDPVPDRPWKGFVITSANYQQVSDILLTNWQQQQTPGGTFSLPAISASLYNQLRTSLSYVLGQYEIWQGLLANTVKISAGSNSITMRDDGVLTTPGEIVISTDNTHGGTGYTGFLTLTSTQAGVTNPNKFIRLNSTGNLQIVNSAYTGTIFDLADNGNVTLSGTLTFPAGGTFNVKGSVPSGSQGAEGDKAGMVAFDGNHMYYCKADYTNGLSDIWVRVVWTETNW